MAQRVQVTLIDDLDGKSEASETLRFGLGGAEYEIDLSDAHADQLRTAMAPFVSNGRRLGHRTKQARRPHAQVTAIDNRSEYLSKVRAWAKEQKIELPARGRIAQAVMEQYEAAHPKG